MKTAKEFWEEKFDESPQSDADKLAVAMMAEYGDYISSPVEPEVMPSEVIAGGNKRWCETCENNNGIFNYNCQVCVKGRLPEMYDEKDGIQREA